MKTGFPFQSVTSSSSSSSTTTTTSSSPLSPLTFPQQNLREVIAETKVVIHMLRDLELAFREGKRAANVLGFDKTGVFTTKATSTTTLEGDAALLAQLAVPKEHCLPIIMVSGGSFIYSFIHSFIHSLIHSFDS